MVLQTNKFYLAQYFQYKIDGKNAKAEFVSDKNILKLILPVIKELFWLFKVINLWHFNKYIIIFLW